jgi:formylglycine-generating enzyme required for sulfatase activity
MAHDVFISYPHQEKVTADAACAKLEAEGIRCWIAPRDVAPSAEWAAAIVDAIDQCRVMVLIFSTHANLSKQVRREVQQAFEEEKPVVPFRIEDVKPEKALRYFIGPVHWLDALTPPVEQHLQKLTASVRGLVRIPMSDEPASTAGEPRHEPDTAQLRAAEAKADRRRQAAEAERIREAEAEQRRKHELKWHAEGRIKIEARIVHGAPDGWFKPGAGKVEWFKDHEDGPEMVVVPTGEFMMGSPETERERYKHEGPLRKVKIGRPFAVGRHAVTRGQFAAFVNITNYKIEGATIWTGSDWKFDPNKSWRNSGFRQDDNHPVASLSWDDAQEYAEWLSRLTGQRYRLLSEAEWEYVARAGTMTPFWWGSSIAPTQANYDGNFVYEGGGAKGEYRQATVPVGTFEPNAWGLYNVHGNVWEWCEDNWHDSYNVAPVDGSAWSQGGHAGCVLRGGSWLLSPQYLRSAARSWSSSVHWNSGIGFRLGRTLTS